jgi:hypothetical protein
MTRNTCARILPLISWLLLIVSPPLAAQSGANPFSAGAPPPAQPAPSTITRPPKPLDLRAPEVTLLFRSEQIPQIIYPTFGENIAEIEVRANRRTPPRTPTVWPGIFAPVWAVLNPTQSWRIFLPLPPDQAVEFLAPSPENVIFLPLAAPPPRMAGEEYPWDHIN